MDWGTGRPPRDGGRETWIEVRVDLPNMRGLETLVSAAMTNVFVYYFFFFHPPLIEKAVPSNNPIVLLEVQTVK